LSNIKPRPVSRSEHRPVSHLWRLRHGHGLDSSMGWVGLGWVRHFCLWNGLGWVGFSCQKL